MPQTNLKRSQFTFYASYFDAVENLPKTRRYEALRAIIAYALEGALPADLTPAANGVFTAIRPNLDASRVKAAARRKELRQGAGDPFLDCPAGHNTDGFDSPTGMNKKKNKKENKKENKNENKNENESKNESKHENEIEYAGEREDQAASESDSETAVKAAPDRGAAREEAARGAAAFFLPSDPRDPLSVMAREEPRLGRVLDQLQSYWQRQGQPLTEQERKLVAWTLALREPEERITAVLEAISNKQRLIPARRDRSSPGPVYPAV